MSTVHKILEKDGSMYLNGHILLIQHPEGDWDRATRDTLVEALYDEYQCSDVIKKGDKFELNGKIIAQCEGVHVVPVES